MGRWNRWLSCEVELRVRARRTNSALRGLDVADECCGCLDSAVVLLLHNSFPPEDRHKPVLNKTRLLLLVLRIPVVYR